MKHAQLDPIVHATKKVLAEALDKRWFHRYQVPPKGAAGKAAKWMEIKGFDMALFLTPIFKKLAWVDSLANIGAPLTAAGHCTRYRGFPPAKVVGWRCIC